jgi:hypothetical protein
MTKKLSKDDQRFIVETAMLECSICENIDIDLLRYFQGKSGAWYIVSRENNEFGKPKKCYFKKVFNN